MFNASTPVEDKQQMLVDFEEELKQISLSNYHGAQPEVDTSLLSLKDGILVFQAKFNDIQEKIGNAKFK